MSVVSLEASAGHAEGDETDDEDDREDDETKQCVHDVPATGTLGLEEKQQHIEGLLDVNIIQNSLVC